MEKWLPVKDFEELYEVSNLGRIKAKDKLVIYNNRQCNFKSRILKLNLHPKGYLMIGLTKNRKRKHYFVHVIVAKTFIENPLNLRDVNHKDGIKTNNNISNLEWLSRSDNIKHAYDVLKRKTNTVINDNLIKQVKELRLQNLSYRKIAAICDISNTTVMIIVNNF